MMIEKLRGMAIFATVVERGTFRAAAKHLGLAPSRISQSVSDLEKDLGVTLLYRSTRQLSLTNEGNVFYNSVKEMLKSAEAGLDALNFTSNQPVGELRITAPAFLTQTGMMDLLSEFSEINPGVQLSLNLSDHPRDLIREEFDVGIRAGVMQDSELMTRAVGESGRVLVASPEYAESRPIPTSPEDLEQWDWLNFSMRPEPMELFFSGGDQVSVKYKFRIEVDSAQALYEFAIRGRGVTPLPKNLAVRGFNQGQLVHILPDWSLKPLTFHAVWPDRSRRESLTLLFVRYLAANTNRL